MLKQEVTTLNDGNKITHFSDIIGKKIKTLNNYYEYGMLDYIRRLGNFDTILDIGANIGNHSVFFGKYVANTVHAIEPVPNNFNLLQKNINQNDLGGRVIPHNFGLSDKEGFMYVKDVNKNMGACDLTDIVIEGGSKVKVKKASTFAYKFGLVKIDCESMSFTILNELLPQIKKNKSHVFIEANESEKKQIIKMGGKIKRVFNATPTYHVIF